MCCDKFQDGHNHNLEQSVTFDQEVFVRKGLWDLHAGWIVRSGVYKLADPIARMNQSGTMNLDVGSCFSVLMHSVQRFSFNRGMPASITSDSSSKPAGPLVGSTHSNRSRNCTHLKNRARHFLVSETLLCILAGHIRMMIA